MIETIKLEYSTDKIKSVILNEISSENKTSLALNKLILDLPKENCRTYIKSRIQEVFKLSESIEWDIILTNTGANKLLVVKYVKEITGLGLKESKDLVDNSSTNPTKIIAIKDLNKIATIINGFTDIGATANFKDSNNI